MNRKRLVDKEKSNLCIYLENLVCKKFDVVFHTRACVTSKNEDGSNPRFCANVPIEDRAAFAEAFQDAIKKRNFKED